MKNVGRTTFILNRYVYTIYINIIYKIKSTPNTASDTCMSQTGSQEQIDRFPLQATAYICLTFKNYRT